MNPKKAIKELEKQLRKEADNLVLRLRLAAAYREVGRTEDAVALYRSVAVAYHAQGRLAQAIAVCKSVLEIEPSQPETQQLLAELDVMRGVAPAPPPPAPVEDFPSLAPKARTAPPRSAVRAPVAAETPPPPRKGPRSPPLSEFGPGSGMTPAHQDDDLDAVVAVDELPRTPRPEKGPLVDRMAALRHAARAPASTSTPRTTERMHEAPHRFSGPLLTPTPLPQPLAMHDSDDDSVVARVVPAARRSSAPLSLSPAAVRTNTPELGRRPITPAVGGFDPDDDVMTRIADEIVPPPLDEPLVVEDEHVIADDLIPALIDDDVEFDGPTSNLADDAMTTIAPEVPSELRHGGGDDEEAMTTIADESGLLPQVPRPSGGRMEIPAIPRSPGGRIEIPPISRRAPGPGAEPSISRGRAAARRPVDPEIFDRATRPIVGALDLVPRSPHADANPDFDDLPTPPPEPLDASFGDPEPAPTPLEDPLEDPLLPPIAHAARATVELPDLDALQAFREQPDDFNDETTDHSEGSAIRTDAGPEPGPAPVFTAGTDDDLETNPGLDTKIRSTPSRPATRDSANDLELDRAFARGFSDTLQRLTPDGAVIDVPLQLFSNLPEAALAEMARRMTLRHYDAGARVVSEGEAGNACFVIAHGEVRVLKRDPLNPSGPHIEVARLGNGALFGEFALLADRRRHATVEAVSPSEIYEIPRRLLRELAVNYPEVGPKLERFYRERLLSTLLWTAPFFKPLEQERRGPMLEKFQPFRAESGEKIVQEGEPAGGLFLIVLGSVEITKRVGEHRSVLLATLGEGAYFGEMSLLRGSVANASVTAVGPTELAVMSPRDFYEVVAEHPHLWDEVRREANRRQLENHQIVTGDTNVV